MVNSEYFLALIFCSLLNFYALEFEKTFFWFLSSRTDKAKKHYESAYSECESLMTYYRMQFMKAIIPNNQDSID